MSSVPCLSASGLHILAVLAPNDVIKMSLIFFNQKQFIVNKFPTFNILLTMRIALKIKNILIKRVI